MCVLSVSRFVTDAAFVVKCQSHLLNPQLAMLTGEEKLVHIPLFQQTFLRTINSAHQLPVSTTAGTF